MKMPLEEIEVGTEMIGEREEPELVGGPDVEDAFETECAGRLMDIFRGIEPDMAVGGVALDVERQHELRIGEGVVVQGEV